MRDVNEEYPRGDRTEPKMNHRGTGPPRQRDELGEVAVLGDHDPPLLPSDLQQRAVLFPLEFTLMGVNGIMPQRPKRRAEA